MKEMKEIRWKKNIRHSFGFGLDTAVCPLKRELAQLFLSMSLDRSTIRSVPCAVPLSSLYSPTHLPVEQFKTT